MRLRAQRRFTLAGETKQAGDLFEANDALGAKLIRTRHAVAVEQVDRGDGEMVHANSVLEPVDQNLGILRRETRTTAPIPNPPAGFEPVHPALLPSDDLTEEHLDLVDGGVLAEEERVRDLVENTDPDSSGVEAGERNAAAEDLARQKQVQEAQDAIHRPASDPAMPPSDDTAQARTEAAAESAPPVEKPKGNRSK
jgi:hypothetical protein